MCYRLKCDVKERIRPGRILTVFSKTRVNKTLKGTYFSHYSEPIYDYLFQSIVIRSLKCNKERSISVFVDISFYPKLPNYPKFPVKYLHLYMIVYF